MDTASLLPIFAAFAGAVTALCGLIVWAVKAIVTRESKTTHELVELLRTSVETFQSFEKDEEDTHDKILHVLSSITETQQKILEIQERILHKLMENSDA